MKIKKLLTLLLAFSLVFTLAACGGQPSEAPVDDGAEEGPYAGLEPVELIAADSTAKGAAGNQLMELIVKNVDEITGGKLTLSYHPNAELGGDADLLRQAKDGDIAMVLNQTAPVVSFIPELAVFDLPMVFAKYDGDTIDKVLNGDNAFTAELKKAYNKAGYELLGFMQNATYRLTTANRNLATLPDFARLQIRTMENVNHMAFWTAIGAEPTPLAWPEVYFALQSGTIDAQENAADTNAGANFQEVQKYLAETNHILYANQIAINKSIYDGLDPAYRDALNQAIQDALAVMSPKLKDVDKENKQKLVDGGMTLIKYPPEFYDEILALDGVKALYKEIDENQVNGLGTLLQDALEAAK